MKDKIIAIKVLDGTEYEIGSENIVSINKIIGENGPAYQVCLRNEEKEQYLEIHLTHTLIVKKEKLC